MNEYKIIYIIITMNSPLDFAIQLVLIRNYHHQKVFRFYKHHIFSINLYDSFETPPCHNV
jgi:hypothetical protein